MISSFDGFVSFGTGEEEFAKSRVPPERRSIVLAVLSVLARRVRINRFRVYEGQRIIIFNLSFLFSRGNMVVFAILPSHFPKIKIYTRPVPKLPILTKLFSIVIFHFHARPVSKLPKLPKLIARTFTRSSLEVPPNLDASPYRHVRPSSRPLKRHPLGSANGCFRIHPPKAIKAFSLQLPSRPRPRKDLKETGCRMPVS